MEALYSYRAFCINDQLPYTYLYVAADRHNFDTSLSAVLVVLHYTLHQKVPIALGQNHALLKPSSYCRNPKSNTAGIPGYFVIILRCAQNGCADPADNRHIYTEGRVFLRF